MTHDILIMILTKKSILLYNEDYYLYYEYVDSIRV